MFLHENNRLLRQTMYLAVEWSFCEFVDHEGQTKIPVRFSVVKEWKFELRLDVSMFQTIGIPMTSYTKCHKDYIREH
jgi:hypothetical protein